MPVKKPPKKEYATPLREVTPEMRGIPVRDAQFLLKGNNRFKGLAPYKDGKIDSVYGPVTAQATKRCKYWLGYPDSGINTVFGQTLYEYLLPESSGKWRPLPKAYQVRRAARLKAAASTPGLKAYRAAEKDIGYKEEPRHHENDSKFGRWYGLNGYPWCAMFESYEFSHTGWNRFRYASVRQIYYDAMAGRNGLRIVKTPQTGDVVGFRSGGDPYAHTAFFGHWLDAKHSRFEDLGGNTGPSNMSNGGAVLKQERSARQVTFFARVG